MSADTTANLTETAGRKNQRLFNLLGLMFISGMVATMAFDLWGQIISPALGLAKLSPHGLAVSLLKTLGLPGTTFGGYFVHFFIVGLIGYPLGWLLVFRPAWNMAGLPSMPFVASLVYGFGLWVFAIGGITLIAGLPFFLGFTGITWVALVGHVLYGVVMVAVMRLFQNV
ncbi:MAG: hypothetical protein ACSHWY_11160 [Octadecabacter sp.]